MKRQILIYLGLLLVTVSITTPVYLYVRKGWILFYHGERLYEEKKFLKAVEYYKQAHEAQVELPQLYYHWGESLTAEKKFDEATTLYKEYLRQHPTNRQIRLHLARVLSYEGKFEESSQEYKKLLEDSSSLPTKSSKAAPSNEENIQ